MSLSPCYLSTTAYFSFSLNVYKFSLASHSPTKTILDSTCLPTSPLVPAFTNRALLYPSLLHPSTWLQPCPELHLSEFHSLSHSFEADGCIASFVSEYLRRTFSRSSISLGLRLSHWPPLVLGRKHFSCMGKFCQLCSWIHSKTQNFTILEVIALPPAFFQPFPYTNSSRSSSYSFRQDLTIEMGICSVRPGIRQCGGQFFVFFVS